jgi:hypothetical protein
MRSVEDTPDCVKNVEPALSYQTKRLCLFSMRACESSVLAPEPRHDGVDSNLDLRVCLSFFHRYSSQSDCNSYIHADKVPKTLKQTHTTRTC